MSGTEDSSVVGASGQEVNSAVGEQKPAAPRKPLKFTTSSKQFVLETENTTKDNKTAVPQLLEQLRPDHARPTVPNAHSMLAPTVFHQPIMPNGPQLLQTVPGMIPMGPMFVGSPQPMGMLSPYPMMGGMAMPMPGSILIGPVPSPQLYAAGPMIQAPIHTQQQQMQQFQAQANAQRGAATPFMPMPTSMPMPSIINTPQPVTEPEVEEEEELTLEEMMKALAEQGELNVSPQVHNQISPGQEAPQEMKMTQDLAAFVSTLTNADYERLYAAYIEECETKQEYNFREDGSDRHTYSGIADYKSESSDDEEANKGEFTGVGHPHRWDDDPAAEARRQEIKKNFFKEDCKGCECCKGFAMNCPGTICASLGVCHCVYRMQCEETGDDLDKVFISERQTCTCCKGLVYKCVCVSQLKKDNCHCIS